MAEVQIDDAAAMEALERYSLTPLPGTTSVTPEALVVIDQLVGSGINEILMAANENENLSGEEMGRVASRLKSAGEALLELAGPILGAYIERANAQPEPAPLGNVEGIAFNEQDVVDLDVAFSIARDAMRALGWNENIIDDFTDLQYRLRLATGQVSGD